MNFDFGYFSHFSSLRYDDTKQNERFLIVIASRRHSHCCRVVNQQISPTGNQSRANLRKEKRGILHSMLFCLLCLALVGLVCTLQTANCSRGGLLRLLLDRQRNVIVEWMSVIENGLASFQTQIPPFIFFFICILNVLIGVIVVTKMGKIVA